jgi:hypothetical protein
MFGFNRTEQKLKAIRKKIEVPSLPEFENNEIVGRTNVKRHVLRFSTCAVVVAVALIGVAIFQGTAGLKTPVQNGTSAQGTAAKNTFMLTAYAASPSSEDNGVIPTIRNVDQSTGTTLQPNVNITLPVGKVDKVGAGSDVGAEDMAYSSGFQFSGDNISSITMTTQKGILAAVDSSKIAPLLQKEIQYYQKSLQNNLPASSYPLTDSEKDLINTYSKSGQTVSFSPSGFTAFWEYNLSNNETASGTISITIKFNDGSTQNKTVTIGESDNGELTADLS